ncbi:MAG: glycosyltransferase family 9 protein [Deltaproteobacteria bacterium]|nr:glycosyltransferase family 9 protein [Deltaproteobacteria bacterium]
MMNEPYHLVIRLSAIGDVLLTFPALHALREVQEGTRLAFLTDPAQAPLLRDQPLIDRLFVWPRDGRGRAAPVAEVHALLKDEAFTSVIDLQNKVRTRRLVAALRRDRALESARLQRRSLGGALLALLGRDRPLEGPHATRLYFRALGAFGVRPPPGAPDAPLPYRWTIPGEGRSELEVFELPPAPRVGLAPASRWPTKDWPLERYQALARLLIDEGSSVVFIGGPDERALHERLMKELPAGRVATSADLGLAALGALLARLTLLVSADSGPAHLASAVGCPVVTLFGPTAPGRWAPGPQGPAVHLLHLGLPCQPCSNHGTMSCPLGHHDCLRGIEVEMVHRAIRDLREAQGSSDSP